MTAHDGFTLADLVAYNEKHNAENGEGGRDGEDHNLSWNCGAEADERSLQLPHVECERRGAEPAGLSEGHS